MVALPCRGDRHLGLRLAPVRHDILIAAARPEVGVQFVVGPHTGDIRLGTSVNRQVLDTPVPNVIRRIKRTPQPYDCRTFPAEYDAQNSRLVRACELEEPGGGKTGKRQKQDESRQGILFQASETELSNYQGHGADHSAPQREDRQVWRQCVQATQAKSIAGTLRPVNGRTAGQRGVPGGGRLERRLIDSSRRSEGLPARRVEMSLRPPEVYPHDFCLAGKMG